jgi:NADPH-ferrihemoprotein reductase
MPVFKPKPPSTNGTTPATSGGGSGGAAVLARLRQKRAESAAVAKQRADDQAASHPVAMLYASQTGTAEEIAHSLYDEACARRLKASVNSLDDFKFDNITPEKTPVLVIVAASTGDGDPPDNSARTLLSFRKTAGSGQLKGVKFTVMGLGDSNYTKFMEVPRTLKRKLLELGATEFYGSAEADEVDGLEDIVDAWKIAIWEPLQRAVCPMVCPGLRQP